MTGETSGPSAQDIRMASFEEKFNDLLNFVRLLVKRDTEIDPNVAPENDPSPKGNWNTLEGPQSLQMYGNGEENVMNKKEDDHSDIRIKNLKKKLKVRLARKKSQRKLIIRMIPHKRHTPKDVVERVEQLEKRLDEVVQSMHQLITLTGTLLKDDRKAIRDLASHSPRGQASTKSLSKTGNRKTPKARNSHASHWSDTNPAEIFLPSAKLNPHLLHDSSKKCEFHFGRPGHSLEDCHALKNKSQGPTTCGIQPVHLTTLPTLSEVGEHTVPKTQPKLMSNFRNLDDQCSSDKEKAEYRASRCMTLKRKIQGLGHSEPDVPFMVQARKPSMHTVPMKKARSTLGFGANGPSRDQTERTIPRSTGAWIPHRQG
uniref:Uncharacterized protein n=1 Tax=Fagus sylvatica TaxID=28930 RepID=A0A2N9H1B8_FAGSY